MSRNRVSHYSQAVFLGPAPSTGYHFLNYDGTLNNNFQDLITNDNLVHEFRRVQNVSFSIDENRTNIVELGTRGTINRPHYNPPGIQLSIDYLQNGITNEMRMGFHCNWAKYFFPWTGQPAYTNNFSVNLLSGFMSRQLTQETGDPPFFPLSYRDSRNIFLVRCPDYDTMLKHKKEKLTEPDNTQPGVDAEVGDYEVFAFGDCYLDAWQTRAAVRDFPRASVNFTCENVMFYLSGSGMNIPALNKQTREVINANKFVIPRTIDEDGPHVLHPGDLTIDIVSSGDSLSGLGIDFRDINIQEYSIDLNLNREPLSSLGYELALDRQITFPIFANMNIGMFVGDSTSGGFMDLLNIDSGYNVTIKLRNPLCRSPFNVQSGNPRQDGPTWTGEGLTAIQYDFKNAQFRGINYESSISTNKYANLFFTQELDPDNLSKKGFFISGLLNVDKLTAFVINDDGEFVVDEHGAPIVSHLLPLF